MSQRPVWAEISIPRLKRNYALLRAAAPGVELMAVVKANAYGHSASLCAPALAEAGARWLGVTCLEEGIAVRRLCPEARILLMSGIWEGEAEGAMEHRLTPVVWETAHLKWIEEAASRLGIDDFAVHLEIDSGMSRQGVRPEAMTGFLHALERSPRVRVEGLMTHFHSPEMFESTATAAQMEKFGHAFERLAASGAAPASGLTPAIASAGNSATALTPAVAQQIKALGRRFGAMPMIRPGLALYGYAPRFSGPGAKSQVAPAKDALAPVLSWKTRVISLRSIAAGKSAGYNATFRAARRTRLALLPVGYADGLNRLLSGDGAKDGRGGHVLVRGQRAPIAGRISMDLTTVDVTDIEGVTLGDEVVLIGEQGGEQGPGDSRERITAYELADAAQTIPYEVLCAIGARVPRRLAEDGQSDA